MGTREPEGRSEGPPERFALHTHRPAPCRAHYRFTSGSCSPTCSEPDTDVMFHASAHPEWVFGGVLAEFCVGPTSPGSVSLLIYWRHADLQKNVENISSQPGAPRLGLVAAL
ncbi:unnamed protein product [Gadus morhua 'NCC']